LTPFLKKIARKKRGKNSYLRLIGEMSMFRWPIGAYQALDGPWSPFNVTTRFNAKALRTFPVSLSCKMPKREKMAFGLFNGPDLALIGRSRSYRDIANRDFAISDVEVLSPRFRDRRFSNGAVLSGLFPMALIFAMRPSRWTVVCFPRDFAI
jgi:hypothetical protein